MVQTEALFICALLWSLERALAVGQALRRGQRIPPLLAITLGVSLGIAALLRQSILPWVAVMGLYLLWTGYRQRRLGPAVATLAAAAAITLLFILPFTLRNYAGRPAGRRPRRGAFTGIMGWGCFAGVSPQRVSRGQPAQHDAAEPLAINH